MTRHGNKGRAELMSLLIFSVLLIVLVQVYDVVETSTALSATNTEGLAAQGNASANTWSAVQLASVGPVIIGAVLVLGIIGMLYGRQ